MSLPVHQAGGHSEFVSPVNVYERLSVVGADIAAKSVAGYSLWERCMAQNEAVLTVVSDVHSQEVVAKRDRLWQDIAAITEQAMPFFVDADDDLLRLGWVFRDTDRSQAQSQIGPTGTVLAASLSAAVDPQGVKRAAKQAVEYAKARPVFKRPPEPVLDISADQVGRKAYQFAPHRLLQKISEIVVSHMSRLEASPHDGLNDHQLSDWHTRAGDVQITSSENRYCPIGKTQKILRYLSDPNTNHNSLVDLTNTTFAQHRITNPHEVYEYFHNRYILPGQASLEDAETLAVWLKQESVTPITPGRLALQGV